MNPPSTMRALPPLVFLLLTAMWLLAPTASADCAMDRFGEVFCGKGFCAMNRDGHVWCSRSYEGGALLTREGRVLCGKGRCAKTVQGEIFCSSEVRGAVTLDRRNRVRCQGNCERATVEQCERVRADSAG